ncbi:MAG: two-component regulator propeller domain-containing protein [Paludibacter sp.]|nr:two-component regulator propeller domain-containing protein [Paludibacter sp.]
MKTHYLLYVFFFSSIFCIAQEIQFDHIDINDGLADNSVRKIFQDKKGYMWFATLNGLSRYDGNNFRNFNAKVGTENSLIYNSISIAKEDHWGYIWCLTYDGKIQIVDPTRNKVINLQPNVLKSNQLFRNFTLTHQNQLWLWGNQGVVKITYNNELSKFQPEFIDTKFIGIGNSIHFLFEDSQHNVWLGTDLGLVKYVDSGTMNPKINNYFERTSFISFFEGKENIWFGTNNDGIRIFNKKNRKFDTKNSINLKLKDYPIYCILPLSNDRIILGSKKILFDVNLQSQIFFEIKHTVLKDISGFFRDSKNNIWLIPTNRGVYRYDYNNKSLLYFDLNSKSREFLGDVDRQLFYEDSNKDLWVGIDGGGLFKYIPLQERFESFTFSEENSHSLSSDVVLSICEDNSKNLWIGTMHGGLNKLNLTSDKIKWHIPNHEPLNILENEIRSTVKDIKGNLWVGSKGGQIICYDSNYKITDNFPSDLTDDFKKKLYNINIYCLFIDKTNNLWIGTKGRGMFVIKNIHNLNKKIDIIHYQPEKYPALDNVYSIKQDYYGQYWIGSFKNGLSLLKNPFSHFEISTFENSEVEGSILSNYIRYVFLDSKHNLWIGTSRGISLLPNLYLRNPKGKFISIVNDSKNLSSLSYNSVDYIYEGSNKKIYVATMGGGLNQLESYNVDSLKFKWKSFNTSSGLSSNTIYAIQEDNNKNLWLSTSLGLNKYNIKNEHIEIFYIEKKHRLSYFTESCAQKLNNGDILFGNRKGFITFNPKEINKISTKFPVVFSRLFINGIEILPEESKILLKSIENTNEINLTYKENSIRLDFSVLDYSNPEKIQYSYILEGKDENWSPLLSSNIAIYQNLPPANYIFRLKATNSDGFLIPGELILKVNIKPPFIKSPLGYTLIICILIIVVVIGLRFYKKQITIQQEIIYADRLNNKKLEYYTNISHEFKTPLTLIIGPAQDLIRENQADNGVTYYAQKILNNAGYLLQLVEQILDFRKISENKQTLQVAHVNINNLVRNIYLEFKPLAEKGDYKYNFVDHDHEIYGYVDQKVLSKITYNLLSNAFKFTSAGKSISLEILTSDNDRLLTLNFRDEGKGISIENQLTLFERFGKSDNSSGLGLSYVKELVDMHTGKISVESELERGTIFTIQIPIDEASYSKSDILEGVSEELNYLEPTDTSKNDTLDDTNPDEFGSSILIIEDNDEMREYLNKKFSQFYKVYLASNGKEGVQVANEVLPDLIISDVMMPIMDGIEATSILRDNFDTSHIPIILLTANSSEEKRLEGLETGADDYINKPFDFTQLQLKIKNIIEKRQKLLQNFNKEPELQIEILTKSKQDKKFIEKVTTLIEENLGKPVFNIDLLSSEMGCSRTLFYKKMKAITGDTPNIYINTIQMKKAAMLLKNTNYSVLDVSVMVGYNDSIYFSKTFKKHFGVNPKTYQIQSRYT